MIVILGAGLAGLSTAYHLAEKGVEHIVFEKDAEPGGLCRSYTRKNHTFDFAGHFFHVQTKEIKKLIKAVMPEGLPLRERSSSIMLNGVRVPFPFQAHVGFLSKGDAADCLAGYIHALMARRATREKTFGKWLVATFGEGMYKRFFKPYNKKFWKHDLDDILIDWTSWSVPQPNVEEVVKGALGIENKGLGYNSSFYYPEQGGIGSFTAALADKVENIKTQTTAMEIEVKNRRIILSDGEALEYDTLVNTMPLPRVISIMKDAPAALKRGVSKLDWIAIDCVQLGFRRENIMQDDWIYIPDEKYPFGRVGRYPGSADDTGTTMFVEFTRRRTDAIPEADEVVTAALDGLTELQIIEKREKPNVAELITFTPAYVVYDKHRRWLLPRTQVFFDRQNIISIGRYGAWEYSAMEGALLAGRKVAEALK